MAGRWVCDEHTAVYWMLARELEAEMARGSRWKRRRRTLQTTSDVYEDDD